MKRDSRVLGRAVAGVVVAALAVSNVGAWADAPSPSESDRMSIEPAISRPSEEAKLTFAAPGIVAEVKVKEGDQVKAGQVLSHQDDAADLAKLASAKLDAESMAEIDYQKADVEFKATVYKRKKDAYDQDGHIVALPDVEEAKQAVNLSEAQVAVAQKSHGQKVKAYEEQQVAVDHKQLRSPMDGIVQKINAREGEFSDPQRQDGAITVVKNDPLWVEMNIASDRAERLSLGQELQVRYKAPPGEKAEGWQTGRITFFPPHADAASGTEMVRLTLPNPRGRRSGLAMEVRLPADVASVVANGPAEAGKPAGLPPLPN